MNRVINFIGGAVGNPVAIHNALLKTGDVSCRLDSLPRTAHIDSVLDWSGLNGLSSHFLRDRPTLNGYATLHGMYVQSQIKMDCLAKLVQTQIFRGWNCLISDVDGLGASKSQLDEFANLDAFAEKECVGLMDDISNEGIARNLGYRGVAIVNGVGDFFKISSWDGRLFLSNTDGAHHFAAAHAVANRLQAEVILNGDIHVRSIDSTALRELTDTYDIFSIKDNINAIGIIAAINGFKAAYYLSTAPNNGRNNSQNSQLIYLPKKDKRSQQVAATFREFGIEDMALHLRSALTTHCNNVTALLSAGMDSGVNEEQGWEHTETIAPAM